MKLISPNLLLDELKKTPITGLARDFIRKITLYHRIQGSSGLENALSIVSEFLSSNGYEVKLFDVPSSSQRGFMETPVSWDVYEGRVEFKSSKGFTHILDYMEHPTLVSAHSPPGEGCGEVTYCRDLSNCEGDVVLVEAPGYIAYKELNARLIILYDSKRHPDAVPYTGLFIGENEVKNTSVVNIPYTLVARILAYLNKGMKVEVCWSVKTSFSSRPQRGLIAYKGSEPGVLYISHICHPKPGAHDNASGVVANLLTGLLIDKASREVPHAHLFIPEYSGTIYADKHLPWTPRGVVNLDMVGSKQWITNSTLNIVIPPLFMDSEITPYTYLATKLVLDEAASFGGFKLPASRYSLSPYTAGSDHDVTLSWGLDSVMLNEWPSKYYHTDMDDIDSISPSQLVNTAIIASLAGILFQNEYKKEEVVTVYKNYLKSWYSIEALKQGVDISPLSRVIDNQVKAVYEPSLTPISSRLYYKKLGFELYDKLRSIKGAHTYISVYAPLAKSLGVENPVELFQLENILSWSSEEKQLVLKAWSLIDELI